jgi:hypothetical protein
MWEGRLRIVETGDQAVLKLEVCDAALCSDEQGCGRIRCTMRELIVDMMLPGLFCSRTLLLESCSRELVELAGESLQGDSLMLWLDVVPASLGSA